jgi:hypothetical protein
MSTCTTLTWLRMGTGKHRNELLGSTKGREFLGPIATLSFSRTLLFQVRIHHIIFTSHLVLSQ